MSVGVWLRKRNVRNLSQPARSKGAAKMRRLRQWQREEQGFDTNMERQVLPYMRSWLLYGMWDRKGGRALTLNERFALDLVGRLKGW